MFCLNKKISIYLASSWFTPKMREILDILESELSSRDNISLYSPRRDGIVLPPNQKHDTSLRESIFKENIENIIKADLVLANIDCTDSYNDPGTIYEVGYAMANNVPVIGFTSSMKDLGSRFKGISDGFDFIILGYDELNKYLDTLIPSTKDTSNKVLLVGAGNEDVDNKIASYIMDSGANLRWVNEMHSDIYSRIDEIFENVQYMIAIIDDRKTLVSWMIGQAYARGIPIITYSDFNWGINVMLLVSVLTHLRGVDELSQFLQQVKREGLESIPKFDISQIDSM